MKTKANQVKPTHPQTANRLCQSLALILAALVLQGCATAKTAWLRHDKPESQPVTVLQRDGTTRDSSPTAVLVSWNF